MRSRTSHQQSRSALTNVGRQLSSFVGRERELAAVQQLLASTPLLTLVGTGGVGKTRLALAAAAEVLGTVADGVWLVELAALADSGLVPDTVAATMRVRS